MRFAITYFKFNHRQRKESLMKTVTMSILLLGATVSVFAAPTNAFVRPDAAIQMAIDHAAKQLSQARTEEEIGRAHV